MHENTHYIPEPVLVSSKSDVNFMCQEPNLPTHLLSEKQEAVLNLFSALQKSYSGQVKFQVSLWSV